jgi:hypothetical protein
MPVSMLVLFVCFWSMLGFGTRAIQLRKPGVQLFPTWLYNPYHHLFFADRFTAAGLRARRLAGVFAIGLLLDVIVVYFRGKA